MKVIIAGSRHLGGEEGRELVRSAISASGWLEQITEVVYGCAPGIDTAAYQVADGIWPTTPFPADWAKHGKSAGPKRNQQMADYADRLIAIPHPTKESKGTQDMIRRMMQAKKLVCVYNAKRAITPPP